jgi:diguanylate cyclase (GGDEF)-like protein
MPPLETLLKIIDLHTEIGRLGLHLAGVMRLVTLRVLDLVDAGGAAIELLDGPDLVYRAVSGMADGREGVRVPVAGSLSGLCMNEGQPLMCDDVELDARVDLQACRTLGLRSMLVIPLCFQGCSVGVLKVMSPQPAHFGTTHIQALMLISEVVGSAIHWCSQYDRDTLFWRATHDELTGLANRSLFFDRLNQYLLMSTRHAQRVGVLAIDMDGLKEVNDALGHAAGDMALVEFSQLLRHAARMTDTVARIGGDEFAVLLTSKSDDGQPLDAVLQRFQALDAPIKFQGQTLWLRGSVGHAWFPTDGETAPVLLAKADQRMYSSKRHRKAEWASSGFGALSDLEP